MTQARPRTILPPTLVSMQIPEAVDWMHDGQPRTTQPSSFPGQQSGAVSNNALLLLPGQSGEIWVKLVNPGQQSLQWMIEITGDFPTSWCLWETDTPQLLLPHDDVQTSIRFQVPPDFFESATALYADKRKLQLNCCSEISVYVNWQGERQLVEQQLFYLYVRSPSNYLEFLPELYRESDFMSRFLLLFEQSFDPAVQTLDTLWAYLDPLTAPKAMLPFLAHWVAWQIDPRFELKQQRRLIKHAIALYRSRGTRYGLRLFLHLYTGLPLDDGLPEENKRISIVDSFRTALVLGSTQLNQQPRLGRGRPYHFSVTLRPEHTDQIDETLVHHIIEQSKPAFCTYDLQIMSAPASVY